MRQQLEQRLKALKAEYEAGQKMLAHLEARQTTLHETVLRIAGAVQVLEEELDRAEQPLDEEAVPAADTPKVAHHAAVA